MDEVRRPNFSLSSSKFVIKDRNLAESRLVKGTKRKNIDLGTDESAIDSFITSDSQKHIGKETQKSISPPRQQSNNFRISMSKPALNSSRGFQYSSTNLGNGLANSKVSTNSITQKQGTLSMKQKPVATREILQSLLCLRNKKTFCSPWIRPEEKSMLKCLCNADLIVHTSKGFEIRNEWPSRCSHTCNLCCRSTS